MYMNPTIQQKNIHDKNIKKMKNLKLIFSCALALFVASKAFSFCGFYVAKADTKLFNETSQVIIARNGQETVVTMSNDFKGSVTDFAMVVPVPTILKENDIQTVNKSIFDKLDAYSAPRMAEYYDRNPCWEIQEQCDDMMLKAESAPDPTRYKDDKRLEKKYHVTIEAEYTVGEYDILILSAKESDGLEKWLLANNYKIPVGAREVLAPYIKNKMKFFVVKVNLEELKKTGSEQLNPIRITYQSEKFMLPIRLGMANAKGDQDMVVYMLSKNGRVETTNYRTVTIPTNNDIPTFVQDTFGHFYKDVFAKAHKKEQGKAVFLEYAWDISARNYVKCDPCVGTPPANQDIVNAGVNWIGNDPNASVFFTRLHVRYNKNTFPQDLVFQETNNKSRFQGRYVIRHPAKGDLDCDRAKSYLKNVVNRRQKELIELNRLTGWNIDNKSEYVLKYKRKYQKLTNKTEEGETGFLMPLPEDKGPFIDNKVYFFLGLALLVVFMLVGPSFINRLRTRG